MNYQQYAQSYFVDPRPESQYKIQGSFGSTLFYSDYEAAVDFYARVFGPPAYIEGSSTRGWPLGDGWLTLLRGKSGGPQNIELMLRMTSPAEAERLHAAFITAGGSGPPPSDQMMYYRIRSCQVCDPFGVDWLIFGMLD